ncbi:putative Pol polyprotein [Cricetulus griseus]|nr:putative Pol polyprotein [Cricetulus griseus]
MQATCLPYEIRQWDPTPGGLVTALPPTVSPVGPGTPEHCRHLGNRDTSIHEKRTDTRVLDLFASTRREPWSHTHQENKKHLLHPPEERMRRRQGKSTSNNRKPNMTPPENRNHTLLPPTTAKRRGLTEDLCYPLVKDSYCIWSRNQIRSAPLEEWVLYAANIDYNVEDTGAWVGEAISKGLKRQLKRKLKVLEQWNTQINIPPMSDTNYVQSLDSRKDLVRRYGKRLPTIHAVQKLGTNYGPSEEPKALSLKWLTDEPVWVRQWLMTSEKLAGLEKLVQEQLDAGYIKESTSPWNSPVFVIKKKSDK